MDARPVPGKAARGTVKIRNISGIPDLLAESGADLGETLARAGLEKSLFSNPEQMISYVAAGRLLHECAQASGLEDFGLRLGMRQSASTLGLAGYVAANAPTVRAAVDTVIASLRLSDTGGSVSLQAERGYATLRWVVPDPNVPAIEHIDDAAMAIGHNILRKVCGPEWSPTEVCLPRARPKNPGVYLKFFGAPVRFETEVASLIFEESHLDRAISDRDADLHELLSPLLERALAESEPTMKERVCEVLRAQILTGVLSPDRAAAALGISARTLSRRLADESVTFSDLAQIVRFEVAQRMLRAGRSLSDIAATLGYSDPTAFIRAFKQFAGVTPARWRRSL